jgi:hypothetical protein
VSSQRSASRRPAPSRVALALVCLGIAVALPAYAQPTAAEKAAALQAFEDGLDLEKKTDYAAALAKFRKVGEFKMTPHVRFHIALCEEKLGQLVSAMRGFELAEAEALKMGKDAQVVAEKAPGRVEALRKRVAAVRIEVKGKVLFSRVLLDGQPLLAKDFGTLVPVDPGTHAIEVETDGAIAQRKEVSLPEKGYETITLEIEDKEKPVATATASASPSLPPLLPPPPPPPPSRLPAIVLGGVGVASFIGAGVAYGLRVGALEAFDEQCPPGESDVRSCPPAAQVPYSDAQTYTVLAGLLTGVGAVAVGGAGAYWLFTRRQPQKSQPTTTIGVSVTPAGVRVLGKF